MLHRKSINMMKYLASFSMIATLAACSSDDGGLVFDPNVPPQNVQVVAGDGFSTELQNTISWSDVPAATDHVVYWNTTGNVDENSGTVDVPDVANHVVHSGLGVLQQGETYYYRVQALSDTQSSVLSAEVKGTPEETTTQQNLNDVAWNGDLLVAVGENAHIITSGNALTDGWSQPAVLGLDNSLSAVTWESANNNGNGQFLIVGAGLTVLVGDGVNPWLPQDLTSLGLSSGNATDLEDVAWVVDRYVVVGKNRVILTSPDGLNWTVENDGGSDDTITLMGVAGNGDGTVTVAVGTNGTLLTSDKRGERSSWNAWTVAENNSLNDVTWDGSEFIVVGSDDTVYTSADGATWEKFDPQGNKETLVAVTQWDSSLPADPLTAVVGSAGTFFVSPDGTTSLFIETGTNEQLSANTWVDDDTNPAYFVVVGHNGFVLTSQRQ